MSEPLLCPLKFNNSRPPNAIDWNCEREGCAWWSKGGERCAIVTSAMGLWATVDAIKDKAEATAK